MDAEAVIAGRAGEAQAGRWSDAAAWHGDGLRREVFFFRSGGVQLYGSLYVAAERSRPFGFVACGSWGVEADRSDPLLRSLAMRMARLGGAGLVFHYPGYGDSFGDLAEASLADLSAAALDAVEEGTRRCPGIAWIFGGFMFGASVACLAQRRLGPGPLLLVQPALRPTAYFERLQSRRSLPARVAGGAELEPGDTPGMAYGYPVPHRIAAASGGADAAVAEALDEYRGEGTVIGHAEPAEAEPALDRFERIDVPGRWRFGAHDYPQLAEAAGEWLRRRTEADAR
jgi:hypothetical protein